MRRARYLTLFLTIALGCANLCHSQVTADTLINIVSNKTRPLNENVEAITSISRYRADKMEEAEYNTWLAFLLEKKNAETVDTLKHEWLVLSSWTAKYRKDLANTILLYEERINHARILKDSIRVHGAMLGLFHAYSALGMGDIAVPVGHALLKVAYSIGDSMLIASTAGSLGWIFTNVAYQSRDSALQAEACRVLEICVDLREKIDPGTSSHIENAKVHCMALARAGRTEEALKRAKHMFRNYIMQHPGSGFYTPYLKQIGNYHLNLQQTDSASHYYNWMVRYNQSQLEQVPTNATEAAKLGMVPITLDKSYFVSPHTAMCYVGLYRIEGKFKKAAKVLDGMLYGPCKVQEDGLKHYVLMYAGKIYQETKEYKKATEAYQEFTRILTESSEQEKEAYMKANKAHTQMQLTFAKERATQEKERLEMLAIEEADKQALRIKLFIAGLVVLLLFLGFVYNRFRITNKQKHVIEKQHGDLELAYDQLDEKNTEILDSITYAKRIQNAILPPAKLVKQYLEDSFILYKPKDIVAGDFYWMQTIEDTVFFAAADCTGHGVPGAMVSVICNNGLNRSIKEFGLTEPGQILDKTRELVIEEFEKSEETVQDGMDIALCALNGKKLRYAGAHNPLWIVRKGSKEVEEIKATKEPIGKFLSTTPFKSHEVELKSGDTIYIFSDGFVDQFGGLKGKKFKAANFKTLLCSMNAKTMEEQKAEIDAQFEKWRGGLEQLDDVCVIGVRV